MSEEMDYAQHLFRVVAQEDEINLLRKQVEKLEAENKRLRGHIEQLREAVEEGLSTYKVPMTARICEAITALAQGRAACGESIGAGGSAANDKEKANA